MRFNPTALLKAREAADLTQEQLAVKAGSSFTTVNRLELGKIENPSLATVLKLADALDVDVTELLTTEAIA
jgi:transcriptional regulator with XRE-family HTH domain